jgi:hypothetical protein
MVVAIIGLIAVAANFCGLAERLVKRRFARKGFPEPAPEDVRAQRFLAGFGAALWGICLIGILTLL